MIYLFLLVILFLQSLLLVYPLVKRKFGQRIRMLPKNDVASVQCAVAQAANGMLSSPRVLMSFNDDESLYAMLAKLKSRMLGKRAHYSYAYFNFPLSFLLLGLLDHYIASRDKETLRNVKSKCEDLLDDVGELKFTFDKIDQASFGLVFLQLYELTHKDRYLTGAHHIYEGVQNFRGEDGLYRYRLGLDVFFIDTIGLLCPFLVRYAEVISNRLIKADAERQVKFALECCVEPNQGLAFHAFDLTTNQPLGSINWARGMGWFLLGLSAVARSGDTYFMSAMQRYTDILMSMREPYGFWPQFLGHTNDKNIDSSGTLMFLYAFQQCGTFKIDATLISAFAGQCIDSDGRVIKSSGDTIYINKYSRQKGLSELSQGLMLSVVSEIKR